MQWFPHQTSIVLYLLISLCCITHLVLVSVCQTYRSKMYFLFLQRRRTASSLRCFVSIKVFSCLLDSLFSQLLDQSAALPISCSTNQLLDQSAALPTSRRAGRLNSFKVMQKNAFLLRYASGQRGRVEVGPVKPEPGSVNQPTKHPKMM